MDCYIPDWVNSVMTWAVQDGSLDLEDDKLFLANNDICVKASGFIRQNMEFIVKTLGLGATTVANKNKLAVCVLFWSRRNVQGAAFSKVARFSRNISSYR